MALKFMDSCGDHYTAAQATRKWTTTLGATRRAGLHGFGMSGSLAKGMLFGSTTIIMEAQISRANAGSLFSLADTNLSVQIGMSVDSIGALEVRRNGTNPAANRVWQSAPDVIRQDTWYHVGWRVKVAPAPDGELEVRVNGETLVALTGIKTISDLNPASSFWSGAIGRFTVGDNGVGVTFDDLVVMDNVDDGIDDPRLPGGGGFDKFLGSVEVRCKRPNAATATAQWTPVPPPNNWDNVNDVEPDDDTTHNAAVTAGVDDIFEMEDLASGEDILAAQLLACARKTEEGTAAIALLVNGTPSPNVFLGNSYSYLHEIRPLAPGGARWSASLWNAIQLGYRKTV